MQGVDQSRLAHLEGPYLLSIQSNASKREQRGAEANLRATGSTL